MQQQIDEAFVYYSKDEIINILSSQCDVHKIKIFKNLNDSDFSLTADGFRILNQAKLYEKYYSMQFAPDKNEGSIRNLVILKKIFNSPYYIKNNVVQFYDFYINAKAKLAGSLIEFIDYYR